MRTLKKKNKPTFIDLFAGLGGFHLALSKLGHECVFASEIEIFLRNHYEENFELYPEGDISKINVKNEIYKLLKSKCNLGNVSTDQGWLMLTVLSASIYV